MYCQQSCYAAHARQQAAESLIARFWAKVNKTETCWLWTGSTTRGYGQLTLPRVGDGRQRKCYAHRFAWTITNGDVPDSFSVLHHCDTPLCVRPNHLFVGTQQDNLADARQKGRLDESRPRTRVLSLPDRLDIFWGQFGGARGVDVALHYGVTEACISKVRQGQFKGAPVFEPVASVQLRILGEVA